MNELVIKDYGPRLLNMNIEFEKKYTTTSFYVLNIHDASDLNFISVHHSSSPSCSIKPLYKELVTIF